jgi:hypothetical protein
MSSQPSLPSPNLPSTGEHSAGLEKTAPLVPPRAPKENDLSAILDLAGALSEADIPSTRDETAPALAATGDSAAPPPFAPSPQQENLDVTLTQGLSDRLLSGEVTKRMLASGYRMVRPLGEGAYGTVWLAVEEQTGIQVAIKFFAHGGGQQWQMLHEEVRQLATLDDANGIVHLKEVVSNADPPYYVMSYAEGGSLAQRLENGPMPFPASLRIFRELVQAIAYVHAHGVRHCDLKPANILFDSLGRALVADFGQAHLSDDASPALGTFFYMAPEQADLSQKIPDTNWDVYGLGALFYAMLTGEPPRKALALSGELSATLRLDHRLRRYREGIVCAPAPTAHRRLPGMDKQLAAIIEGCLELDPKKRIPSAEAIIHALEKRKVRRRQRPLFIYGMIAPLAVILLMALVGLTLFDREFHHEMATVQDSLKREVLAGDRTMAALLANGMEIGLKRRITDVQALLEGDSGEKLRGLIAEETSLRTTGADQNDFRKRMGDWLKNAASHSGAGKTFSGLIAADADGFVLMKVYWDGDDPWHMPPEHEILWAQNWSWRDWFSGQGSRLKGITYPPVSTPHISQPFRSKEKERGIIMEVTVPVKNPEGKVVGVLAGILTWEEFGSWLKTAKVENGQVVVFNQRGQTMKHQTSGADDIEAAVMESEGDANPPAHAEELASQLIPGSDLDVCDSFIDPFQKGEGSQRIAGYKFFNPNDEELDSHGPLGTRWGVIVEHNKDEVMKPVSELHQFMISDGLWMLVAAGVLTGAVWAGLIWLLRREERLGHG